VNTRQIFRPDEVYFDSEGNYDSMGEHYEPDETVCEEHGSRCVFDNMEFVDILLPKLANAMESLKLSEEQKARLTEILEDTI